MLRQGAPVREFTDPAALAAHYRALRARTWSPRDVRPPHGSHRTRARSDAQQERLESEADARRQAELTPSAEGAALVSQILDPGQIAGPLKRIISYVAEAFGTSYAEIVGPRQTMPLVRARWAAIDAMRKVRPDMPMSALGRALNRDGTSIQYAMRRMATAGVPVPPRAGEVERIIDDVAEAFGFTRADILGARQAVPLVRARWAAIAAVRAARPDLSLQGLGCLFGDRDHTTIRHALEKMAVGGVPQPPSGGADA